MGRQLVASVRRARADVLPAATTALLVAVIIGPMARRGWVVTLDWVCGPAVAYWPRLGDRSALPAGPLFFAAAALLRAATGAAVGWLVPALSLLLAGWCAARAGGQRATGRVAAAAFAVWNPFVHERLYAGQPAVLAGYAALLGLAASARNRSRAHRPLRLAAWWTAAAACSIQFAVLGALVLLAFDGAPNEGVEPGAPRHRVVRRGRDLGLAAAATTALTATWLALGHGAAPASGGRAALDAFATRADPQLGLALGTLAQRGFWRAAPAAPGLAELGIWPQVAALVALAPAGFGLWCWAGRSRRAGARLCAAAMAAWVLSWGAAGPLGPLYRAAVLTLPGGGAFREPGKFLAVLSVLGAVLTGTAFDRLASAWASAPASARTRRLRSGRVAPVASAVLAVALAVATTPSLAWGVGGRLAAVRYPAGWERAHAVLVEARPASVLVLPRWAYLDPGFTSGRIVSDPATAYFGPVIRPGGDIAMAGVAPPEADRRAAAALAAADGGAQLAELGIDWVLVLRPLADAEAPGMDAPAALGLRAVVREGDMVLWQRGTIDQGPAPRGR